MIRRPSSSPPYQVGTLLNSYSMRTLNATLTARLVRFYVSCTRPARRASNPTWRTGSPNEENSGSASPTTYYRQTRSPTSGRAYTRSVTSGPSPPCRATSTSRHATLVRGDDGTMRLIDYEHARYDLAARDLVGLATRVWPRRPDLKESFLFFTYGELDDLDLAVIEHVDALTARVRAAGRCVSRIDVAHPASQ